MKISSLVKWLAGTLVAAAFLAFAGPSLAQPEKEKSSSRPQPSEPPFRSQNGSAMGGRFAPGLERLFSLLTDEQRASFRDAIEGDREKMRDLEEKLRDARRDLFQTGLTGKFEEDVVRNKAMAAAKIDAEITVLRAKAFSQMRPPLSAEQLEKIRNFSPGGVGESAPTPARTRPDIRRDENGLPLKKENKD